MTRTVCKDGFSAYLRAWEARIGSFLEIDEEAASKAARARGSAGASGGGPLAGLPFGVKDNVAVAGMRLSCGSRALDGFVSPYTATAVARLVAAGAAPVGKTNMDEFGMGSSTDTSAYGRTNNPWDVSRVAGGSSGGSAAAVAAGLVPFALGSDTGGSVRQPANFCGVVGLKPTNGAVSRFGLVAYASSLETIGVLADSAARARDVFEAMRGADPLDQTSRDRPDGVSGARAGTGERAGARIIGVLSPEAAARALARSPGDGASGDGTPLLEPEVAAAFEEAKERMRSLGYRLEELELPSLAYASAAYYTIALAEASANLARFDGVRYGRRLAGAPNPEALVEGARAAGFGDEVRLRILLGTFALRAGFQDRYYLRAQHARAGIRRDFERALAGRDAVLMPVYPTRAFGRGAEAPSPFAQKAADLFTCCANLAGLPALAFPTGVSGGLPVGVQLVGAAFGEDALLDAAEEYGEAYPTGRPDGYEEYWT